VLVYGDIAFAFDTQLTNVVATSISNKRSNHHVDDSIDYILPIPNISTDLPNDQAGPMEPLNTKGLSVDIMKHGLSGYESVDPLQPINTKGLSVDIMKHGLPKALSNPHLVYCPTSDDLPRSKRLETNPSDESVWDINEVCLLSSYAYIL